MKPVSIRKSKVSMLAGVAIIGVCLLTALATKVTSAAQATETEYHQEESEEYLSNLTEESKLQEGWYLNSKDHKWYYIKDHVNVTGWLELDGKWFYFDEQGAMVNDTTLKIGGVEYTFSKSGKCTKAPVK